MTTITVPLPPRPQVRPPAAWRAPRPEWIRLDQGLTVGAVHLPGQQVAAIDIHLGIDLSAEPDGAEGIAAVMAASLADGSLERFTGKLAAYGATWDSGVDHTGPHLACQVPVAYLAPVIELIAHALREVELNPADIAQQIQVLTAQLTLTDPAGYAARRLAGSVFSPSERAGRPASGTSETLAQLSPEYVADFHHDHLTAAGVTIVIAGDLSGIDLEPLVTDAFGTWRTPGGHAPFPRSVPHGAEPDRPVRRTPRRGAVPPDAGCPHHQPSASGLAGARRGHPHPRRPAHRPPRRPSS